MQTSMFFHRYYHERDESVELTRSLNRCVDTKTQYCFWFNKQPVLSLLESNEAREELRILEEANEIKAAIGHAIYEHRYKS